MSYEPRNGSWEHPSTETRKYHFFATGQATSACRKFSYWGSPTNPDEGVVTDDQCGNCLRYLGRKRD